MRPAARGSTMSFGEILLGVCLVVASSLAFWFALPRDGQVRPFMRNDAAQAYFVCAVLLVFMIGLANVITGLWPG
jgi:hypothetical protein